MARGNNKAALEAASLAAWVPPGWYADPLGIGAARYWDGTRWLDRYRDAPPPQPIPIKPHESAEHMDSGVPESSGVTSGAPHLHARLDAKAKAALDENLSPGETVLVVIRGAGRQAMIGTDRRVFVFKKGFLAGAAFGSEITSWDYRNVAGIQLHVGMMTGAVVVQSSGQAGARTNYWRNNDSDPHKAPNAIPVVRPWEPVKSGVAELRRLIEQAHSRSAEETSTVPPEAPSLADEIAKLAGHRDAGVLTEEEFAAAKSRLLSRD